MRQVLEVRFYKKQFSFIDQLGITTDKLTKELGLDKIAINGSRIDIASDNLDRLFFFTVESMGLQIEGTKDFETFKENIETLKKLVDKNLVDIDSVARIGTKTSVITHAKGKSFDATKQLLMNSLLSSLPDFNESVGIKSSDVGYIIQDGVLGDFKLHSQIGPVTFNEAINRFLGGNVDLYSDFGKDGLYLDLDIFDDKVSREANINELFNQITKQVEAAEAFHQKLLKYVFESQSYLIKPKLFNFVVKPESYKESRGIESGEIDYIINLVKGEIK